MPTVGVSVITSNRAQLLERCLDSVLTQTRLPDVLVICDDASRDDTPAVIDRAAARCLALGVSVRRYRHEAAMGQEANRQFCLKHVPAELVAVLDDDDLWRPDFLSRMTAELERHSRAEFASCGVSLIGADDAIRASETESLSVQSGRSLLQSGPYENLTPIVVAGMPFMLGATVFRREALARINFVPVGSGDVCDWALMCALAMSGATASFVPERMFMYRIHSQGRVSDRLAFHRDRCRWARQLINDDHDPRLGPLLRARAILAHGNLVMELAHAKMGATALREAVKFAHAWGCRALVVQGLMLRLPAVLLGGNLVRRGRASHGVVPCGGLLTQGPMPERVVLEPGVCSGAAPQRLSAH